jgi:hypothetical protein
LEVKGAFEVGLLFGSKLLELGINPDAKSIQEAAAARDNRASLERGLVDFEGKVEHRERLHIAVEVVVEEFAFAGTEVGSQFAEPGLQEVVQVASKGLGIGGREKLVRSSIVEVVCVG